MTTSSTSAGHLSTSTPSIARAWTVGVDGSPGATRAAEWAAAHAEGRADSLMLTAVWSVPTIPTIAGVGMMAGALDPEPFRTTATAVVDRAIEAARSMTSVPVSGQIVQGHSSSALVEAAKDSSLLVVGSRGQGGFTRLVLGSTSTQCVTHNSVPTAVIPVATGPEQPVAARRHVMVAFDGSENSVAALKWALDFASPNDHLECVYVWDVTPIVVGADQFFFPEATDLARERFDHLVDRVVAEFGGELPSLHRNFVEGRPRQELVAAAVDADLVVMGARGHGAIGSVLLGSVSTSLLHQLHLPMVVVPHVVSET